jgi:hypothetical protein
MRSFSEGRGTSPVIERSERACQALRLARLECLDQHIDKVTRAAHAVAVAWPVQVLGSVLGLAEKVDTALDQMEPGSPFLKNLALGRDPTCHTT